MFIVDSNFFIQAHRSTYPLDVANSFWIKVKELVDAGTIISIDKVRDEIYSNEDDLKGWCQANLPKDFFLDTSTVLNEYASVVNWAQTRSGHYKPEAISEFMATDEADAWLVATGLNKNLPIIMHEKSPYYNALRSLGQTF